VTAIERGYDGLLEAFKAGDQDVPFLLYRDSPAITRAQVAGYSRSLAVALDERYVRPGDRVGVLLQNDPQFVITLLALWQLGAIAVSISPLNRPAEIEHVLRLSAAVAVIADDVLWGVVGGELAHAIRTVVTTSPLDFAASRGALADRQRVRTTGTEDLLELCAAYAGEFPAPRPSRPDQTAVLTCTSGTTGPAKGARNTHANLVAGGRVYQKVTGVGRADVIGGFAPLFHVTGLSGHVALSVLSGAPLVLNHRFEPQEVLAAIERRRVTFTVASITALTALAQSEGARQHDLTSLTRIYSGGQPVPASSADLVQRVLGSPVHLAYGMTETTAPTHLVPFGSQPRVGHNGALSVGPSVPGLTTTIVDGEDRPVPAGEPGEICVTGPTVVPGYHDNPQETAIAFRGGHLHTGDIGYVDTDGWLYVVDRIKDQINVSGYKVWPTEVEDVLVTHPGVHEAAVVGVPDDYRGESVKAFVSAIAGAELDPAEVQAWARERLAAYKYPREVVVLADLPKSATGKILRRSLRDATDG
jgi:long-chain acyl-CoA synthetase